MAYEYSLSNEIEEVRITNPKGELITVLKINKSDPNTPKRFKELAEKLKSKGEAYQNQSKALTERAGDNPTLEALLPVFDLRVQFCRGIGRDIDAIFGEGTVLALTSENRAINPDFEPDEIFYANFIEMIMPVMGDLFADHFNQAKKKYGVK